MACEVDEDIDLVGDDRVGELGVRQPGCVAPYVGTRGKLLRVTVLHVGSGVAINLVGGPVMPLEYGKHE